MRGLLLWLLCMAHTVESKSDNIEKNDEDESYRDEFLRHREKLINNLSRSLSEIVIFKLSHDLPCSRWKLERLVLRMSDFRCSLDLKSSVSVW